IKDTHAELDGQGMGVNSILGLLLGYEIGRPLLRPLVVVTHENADCGNERTLRMDGVLKTLQSLSLKFVTAILDRLQSLALFSFGCTLILEPVASHVEHIARDQR